MLSKPGGYLVEPIEDESVPIRVDERPSDRTLVNLVAYRGTKVVNQEGFKVLLGFPRREVDQKRYSSRSAFSLTQVLDQGVGCHSLARTGLSDNKEASLGGLEGGDDVVCDLLGDGLRLH